jgi:hypothetical protein
MVLGFSGFRVFWNSGIFPLTGSAPGLISSLLRGTGSGLRVAGLSGGNFRKDLSLLPVWPGRFVLSGWRFRPPLHPGALLFDFVEKEEGEAWSALSLRVSFCGLWVARGCRRDDAELRFF